MKIIRDYDGEPPELKAKTRQEVADEYGICVSTLNSRLKKANIILEPGLIFPSTLEIIYETFGETKVINNQPKRIYFK
jgi:hypothetical protein